MSMKQGPSRKWRKKRASWKAYTIDHALRHPEGPFTSKHRSRWGHIGVSLFGFTIACCLACAGLFVGMLIGMLPVYYLMQMFPALNLGGWYVVGVGVGMCSACVIGDALRHFCYFLKHQYLKHRGIAVRAVVTYQHLTAMHGPRGGNGLHVNMTLGWQHPETGQLYEYMCDYTFLLGLSKKEEKRLYDYYWRGEPLALVFSPLHPWFFVVEIPFVPCWFDVLF